MQTDARYYIEGIVSGIRIEKNHVIMKPMKPMKPMEAVEPMNAMLFLVD